MCKCLFPVQDWSPALSQSKAHTPGSCLPASWGTTKLLDVTIDGTQSLAWSLDILVQSLQFSSASLGMGQVFPREGGLLIPCGAIPLARNSSCCLIVLPGDLRALGIQACTDSSFSIWSQQVHLPQLSPLKPGSEVWPSSSKHGLSESLLV